MTWADTPLVVAVTGAAVADVKTPDVLRAQMDIENQTGVLEGDRIGKRDLVWLGRATAYQWAWRAEQFDLLTRSSVSSASQDGQSATWDPNGHILGPLARECLRKLSWTGSRTEHIQQARERSVLAATLQDNGDPRTGWRRM